MNNCKISFDESMPLVEIMRKIASVGWTLREDSHGDLIVVDVEEIDYDNTPLPGETKQEALSCES